MYLNKSLLEVFWIGEKEVLKLNFVLKYFYVILECFEWVINLVLKLKFVNNIIVYCLMKIIIFLL